MAGVVPLKKERKPTPGRWSMQLAARHIVEAFPFVWHTMDDIAKAVFGSTSKNVRKSVRQHVSGLRRYMVATYGDRYQLVTRFSSRGKIEMVKLYSSTIEEDRVVMMIELQRQRARKEITDRRFLELRDTLGLTDSDLPEIK